MWTATAQSKSSHFRNPPERHHLITTQWISLPFLHCSEEKTALPKKGKHRRSPFTFLCENTAKRVKHTETQPSSTASQTPLDGTVSFPRTAVGWGAQRRCALRFSPVATRAGPNRGAEFTAIPCWERRTLQFPRLPKSKRLGEQGNIPLAEGVEASASPHPQLPRPKCAPSLSQARTGGRKGSPSRSARGRVAAGTG